jgi:hypothetical protein
MQPNLLKDPPATAAWSVIHPLSADDSTAVAALRSVVAPVKGKIEGTAGGGAVQRHHGTSRGTSYAEYAVAAAQAAN